MASKDILIVDDIPEVREILKEFFRSKNFYVDEAENAEEALDILQKKRFDFILTDYDMPGIKGDELVKIVKEKHPHSKVWGMSSSNNQKSFYQAGADFFLEKPFNLLELNSYLKIHFLGEC
jgi:two-component system response regulator